VIRDLISTWTQFFKQYHSIKPYLITKTRRRKRSGCIPRGREELDGLYECILCACCSTSCRRSGGSGQFVGPAGLLQAFVSSRQPATRLRLSDSTTSRILPPVPLS